MKGRKEVEGRKVRMSWRENEIDSDNPAAPSLVEEMSSVWARLIFKGDGGGEGG